MISSPVTEHGVSLMMVEGGLTAIAVATAFCWPRIGSAFFSTIENLFGSLARKQGLAVLTVGITAILLRLAILPLVPVPHAFVPDDFSFLLAADTFASGHLTNPTPVMWTHFESIHITMKPTYMSMYFPANGLALAAGKVLFGHPWFGLLCMMGLMCAGICWMLQAWLPPTWALLGGLIAVLRLGLFSYWINTYSGGGSIAAFGGALVLGSLPRLKRTPRLRYGLLLAVGVILLAITRPYEGILLCIPVAIVLSRWVLVSGERLKLNVLVRSVAIPLVLITAAGAWMGYYNYRAFGSPLTPPYKVDRATYAMAPYYAWQSPRPEPIYRHKVMRDFYYNNELTAFKEIHNPSGFLRVTFFKCVRGIFFFSGLALLPSLIMLPRLLTDRRIRFLLLTVLVLMVGMVIQIFLIPHYLAPFTAVFYTIGLQATRHLRVWRPGSQAVGVGLVRLMVTVCVVLGVVRLCTAPIHLRIPEWPASSWTGSWYGPLNFGVERAQIENELERSPGKQLAIVRYSSNHNPLDEWVYNSADINNSKVIWAREMGATDNLELIRYYGDRTVWLVQPDLQPAGISLYPMSETKMTPPSISSTSIPRHQSKTRQRG